MKIRIKAFASVKELVGFEEKDLIVSDGISIAEVIDLLAKNYTDLNPHRDELLYAKNEEYCSSDDRLDENDTLAIFPQVSGG